MEIDQENLEQETERALTPPPPEKPKKSKKGRGGAKKSSKKLATKKEMYSDSDFDPDTVDNGSDSGPDHRDMDIYHDPEVTMATMGPSPRDASPEISGPRTRNRSKSSLTKK